MDLVSSSKKDASHMKPQIPVAENQTNNKETIT